MSGDHNAKHDREYHRKRGKEIMDQIHKANQLTLEQAAQLALSAIEDGVPFDVLDNRIAPLLRDALASSEEEDTTEGLFDNVAIFNPKRDKAWEAFIKRKSAKHLFKYDFKFPLGGGYYELWCIAWDKAWDAGWDAAREEKGDK